MAIKGYFMLVNFLIEFKYNINYILNVLKEVLLNIYFLVKLRSTHTTSNPNSSINVCRAGLISIIFLSVFN